jgi:LPS sulfotransferase NodH
LKIHLHRQHVEWENRCWNAFFKDNGIEPYRLVYEDLAAEPLKTLNELLSSFGAEPAQSEPLIPIARQGSGINADWKRRYERDRRYHPYLRVRDAAKAIKQTFDSLLTG